MGLRLRARVRAGRHGPGSGETAFGALRNIPQFRPEPAPTAVTATPPRSTAPDSSSEPQGPGPCGPVRTWACPYFSTP